MKKRKATKYKGFNIFPIVGGAWMIYQMETDWIIFDLYSECTEFIDKHVQ
jgi:hypothetical protein